MNTFQNPLTPFQVSQHSLKLHEHFRGAQTHSGASDILDLPTPVLKIARPYLHLGPNPSHLPLNFQSAPASSSPVTFDHFRHGGYWICVRKLQICRLGSHPRLGWKEITVRLVIRRPREETQAPAASLLESII